MISYAMRFERKETLCGLGEAAMLRVEELKLCARYYLHSGIPIGACVIRFCVVSMIYSYVERDVIEIRFQ